MDKEILMVTIRCAVYNHESYIRQCLEGFVMQKTNFRFEAIVHDDASTDCSATIIREYAEKYPDIIKPIFETENQYSKRDGSLARIMNEHTHGKYVAFCEGDDYWIDPFKLQKQVDALETNINVDACTHKQIQYHAITKEKLCVKSHGEIQKVLPIKDVILGEGGFVGTNTMLYRSSVALNPMSFRHYMNYDYTWQIQGALRGGILYLPECMAAYNYAVPDSFCSKMKGDDEAERIYISKKIRMLDILDEETGLIYHRIINARKMLYMVASKNSVVTNVKNFIKYSSGFVELSLKDRIKTLLRIFFPYILRQRMNRLNNR